MKKPMAPSSSFFRLKAFIAGPETKRKISAVMANMLISEPTWSAGAPSESA